MKNREDMYPPAIERNMNVHHVTADNSRPPLPPSIIPIAIVSGTDYEMGYQYGLQVGNYIEPVRDSALVQGLKRLGNRRSILRELKGAHYYIEKYAPEELERMKGIADGATKAGHKLSFNDVLLINTNVRHPTSTAAHPSPDSQLPPEGCCVWAAWGSTTTDGNLICGDSKDEMYSYQVLTVVFPKEGNNYIITGKAGELGQHFTMNNKGLFVGASGAPGEREVDRDYGIPYSCTFSHVIQFCNNADEAKNTVSSWKVYWDRGLNFTLVDTRGAAFVVEMTAALKKVRVPGEFGETDFIFATNDYFSDVMKPACVGATFGNNSPLRNKQLFSFLRQYRGSIDTTFAEMMWRYPGYGRIGNLYNHRVAIALPRDGNDGVALVCTGPAGRDVYSTYATGPGPYPGRSNDKARVGHDYFIDPTYSFYKLMLASSPAEVVEAAKDSAHDTNAMVYQDLKLLNYDKPGYEVLNRLYAQSVAERFEGIAAYNRGMLAKGNSALSYFGRAATAFARSQAHGLQVHNALIPPPSCPKDLGFPDVEIGKESVF